uniref:SWR1-complex protein 5 n=1 Tax=Blastobotrys adeninivorans TaxID=409370 RepID=A0A060T124_BLAAD
MEEKKHPEEEEYRESEDEDFKEDEVQSASDSEEEEEEDKESKEVEKKYNDIQGGGLIKTRSQREAEKKEKKFKAVQQSSIDVDALWEDMKKGSDPRKSEPGTDTAKSESPQGPEKSTEKSTEKKGTETTEDSVQHSKDGTNEDAKNGKEEEEYITINRRYMFAGKMTTETKRVPRSSAEAQAYLKEQAQLRKPVRRKRSGLEAQLENLKAQKMNTLEKSRLDWLGFVDKEGIKDELVHHNKGGYLHKQDFLSRVDANLENARREAAKKSK